MRKNLKYSVIILSLLMSVVFLPSCKDFLNPDQELNITKDKLFDDWYEYRSVAIGLYGLQQKLVEQLVVLGELRGDLLTVTPNADADLVEIYNFKASKTNKYADPTNFYKLIAACNSFITQLKTKHPEVTDKTRKDAELNNYDKVYGEVLCMRAWAYFNAVRIYGKVPVIYESLTSVEEIQAYLSSSTTYQDSVVVYGQDGYHNTKQLITLTKEFYDVDQVVRVFTKQLVEDARVVGVNHYSGVGNNNDATWEVTIWNTYAKDALLGQMYLTLGDLANAEKYLNLIAKCYDPEILNRYQLDATFSDGQWRNIFTRIDRKEHIFTLNFSKANQQQNDFQRLFEPVSPHQYMLKPTKAAIDFWETNWRDYSLTIPDQNKPWLTTLNKKTDQWPADYYRGFGSSYLYVKNGSVMAGESFNNVIRWKMAKDVRSYTSAMDGVDTMVYKYSINKLTYDEDANFIIYRAGGIQLYLAEIYTWYAFNATPNDPNGTVKTDKLKAVKIVNDGSNYSELPNRPQLGIRGRVGYSTLSRYRGMDLNPINYNGIQVGNFNYQHDPYTNEVTGYLDLSGKTYELQLYLEEKIMDEKARELAYEGERFYDLVRVANRRDDPSFLANKVSAKFPSGQRAAMKALLMDKKNWYIHMFD